MLGIDRVVLGARPARRYDRLWAKFVNGRSVKDRIEELDQLIAVAHRQAARARERGSSEIADSYAGAERRWRTELDCLLRRREES